MSVKILKLFSLQASMCILYNELISYHNQISWPNETISIFSGHFCMSHALPLKKQEPLKPSQNLMHHQMAPLLYLMNKCIYCLTMRKSFICKATFLLLRANLLFYRLFMDDFDSMDLFLRKIVKVFIKHYYTCFNST